MSPSDFNQWLLDQGRPTLVMGVLNVTPDSFSDGGEHFDPAAAVEFARTMIDDGADLIDVGGESTRPGAARIQSAEQIRRIVPVIRLVAKLGITISVDTTRSAVAEAAIDAGAHIINDVSAGTDDPAMLTLAARTSCPVVLMHMLGQPATMQANPVYADVVKEVAEYLLDRAAAFEAAGVRRGRILLDPGIGFGKTVEHNLELLRGMKVLASAHYPLVIGTSRKGFIGHVLDQPVAADRIFGTAATIAWSVANGAGIVRVHDVRPMKQVTKMIRAILQSPGTSAR
jgi:dihydropteroate synthase